MLSKDGRRAVEVPVPASLRKVQQWFGGIIERPLEGGGAIAATTPSGSAIADEALRFLKPSPTLQAWQRIELYNKQYWYRLIGILQKDFPLVLRLFGYDGFNREIVIPCLAEHPPEHWNLSLLGGQLLSWIERCYHEPDRPLVLDSARLDRAFEYAFVAGELPVLEAAALDVPVVLQSHMTLFEFHRDLLGFRSDLLRETPEYWQEHDFPELGEGKHFVVYRSPDLKVRARALAAAEYFLLSKLQRGCTLADACDHLEQADEELVTEAAAHLQHWCHDWMQSGFLATLPV